MSIVEIVLSAALIWLAVYILVNRICICVEKCVIAKSAVNYQDKKKDSKKEA